MGLFFFKPYKEKIANKLYDCFFEKENLIYNFKIAKDDPHEFSIIVASSGIFIFYIGNNEGEIANYFKETDEFLKIDDNYKGIVDIENPYLSLKEAEDYIKENFKENLNFVCYLIPLFNNLKKVKEDDKIFTIKTFKKILKNTTQIYNNREVDEITSLIKEINKYEHIENN